MTTKTLFVQLQRDMDKLSYFNNKFVDYFHKNDLIDKLRRHLQLPGVSDSDKAFITEVLLQKAVELQRLVITNEEEAREIFVEFSSEVDQWLWDNSQ